ncbi:MAG TPA: glycosyl transferase family 90 [Bauldia sp.]|nr:glycosyl transferase family 90 [Bauldia sp.]
MIKRKPDRVIYYARNIALELVPPFLFRRKLDAILASAGDSDPDYLAWRVNYYAKIDRRLDLPPGSPRIRDVSWKQSMYYYDFREAARYFPSNMRVSYLFGDVRAVPTTPSFVKSRPITPGNQNSVLLKLNKFRHYYLPKDPFAFDDKKAMAVWRGGRNNRQRQRLVRRYRNHPLCDVGHSHGRAGRSEHDAFLHPVEQMAFRYIISIEGNDVASNLKWILASNSLCLMPRPRFETWFMEGRLEAGRHYAEIADDLGDLEEKILHYERHPDEALAIISNANDFVRQFREEEREKLISILVVYKYAVATGQIEPDKRLEAVVGVFP